MDSQTTMLQKLEALINTYSTNYTSPDAISVLQKTFQSHNITIEDWNQLLTFVQENFETLDLPELYSLLGQIIDTLENHLDLEVSGTVDENDNWDTLTINGETHSLGGGGGAIYQAGNGISISDFTISIDDTVVATKSFVSDNYATKSELQNVAEIAEGKSKAYVINTQSQITGTKDSDNNYTNVTAITGITLTDLHLGDIIYIKELNVPDYWVSAMVYNGDVLESISLNKMETSKVDLDDYAALNGNNAFTGNNTHAGTEAFNGEVTFWQTAIFKNKVGGDLIPRYNASSDIGSSSFRWKEGFINKITDVNGSYSSDNVLNVINASDIVNNTLTQAQYDLITNGKPTLIKGSLLSRKDLFLLPGGFYGAYRCNYFGTDPDGASFQQGIFYVNTDKTCGIIASSQSFLKLSNIYQLNGRLLNYYLNNVYPYATNSTTELKYETINNISVSADTTFTLATAPANTYPEYKANITNSGASDIDLTFTGVSVIKTNDSNITIASNVLTLPAGTTIEVNIQNGNMIAFNWSAN